MGNHQRRGMGRGWGPRSQPVERRAPEETPRMERPPARSLLWLWVAVVAFGYTLVAVATHQSAPPMVVRTGVSAWQK